MNSLDAIIATTFLLAGFGILLGVVLGQEELALSVGNSVRAKGDALFCAGVIDSVGSNAVDSFDGKKGCYLDGKMVVFEGDGKKKEIGIFDINRGEHYDSRSNIFD